MQVQMTSHHLNPPCPRSAQASRCSTAHHHLLPFTSRCSPPARLPASLESLLFRVSFCRMELSLSASAWLLTVLVLQVIMPCPANCACVCVRACAVLPVKKCTSAGTKTASAFFKDQATPIAPLQQSDPHSATPGPEVCMPLRSILTPSQCAHMQITIAMPQSGLCQVVQYVVFP